MKRILLIFLLIACGASLLSASPIWNSRRGSAFYIYYHPADARNVDGLVKVLEKTLPDMQRQLYYYFESPVSIYISATQEEFDQVTGGKLPAWSQGVSFPENQTIVLKSPAFSLDEKTFHLTGAHEMVHLLVARMAGTNVPRWLNEGLALLLSGEGPGKPLMPLSRALWSGRSIPLENVELVDSYSHNQAELAYLESYNAAEFFVKQYGWEAVRRVLADLSKGQYWNDALSHEIQVDQAGFEALWRVNLEKSYRWMILLDVQIYVFLGITLLVVVVGIVLLRRRRKVYKQWEMEDATGSGTL
jgi:hypothetical protein